MTTMQPSDSTLARLATVGILEALPLSRWHRQLVVLVGIGTFFDLYEVFLGGVLTPILAREWNLSATEKAAVPSSAFAGMFVGAVVLSMLADRLGRRRVFILNLIIYSTFSFAAAFSPDLSWFLVLRFLAGLGLGAELVLADTYLAEFLPGHARGRYTAWAYTIGFCGVPFAALLGGRLLAAQELVGVSGWRWLLAFGGLGAVFVLVLRQLLPESPRWLESCGRAAEAAAVTADITCRVLGRRVNRPNLPRAHSVTTPSLLQSRLTSALGCLREAFRGTYHRRTIMLFVFHVLQTVAYYSFGTLAPLILTEKGYGVTHGLTYVAITFIGYPLGSLLSVPLVERFERKYLIIGSALSIAVFGIVFAASSSTVLIIAVGFMLTMASNIFSNAFHIYQAEIFPTSIRSTVSGAAYSLSRATSAVLPFVAVPLLGSIGATTVFTGAAMLIVLLCVDVGVLGPRSTSLVLEDAADDPARTCVRTSSIGLVE